MNEITYIVRGEARIGYDVVDYEATLVYPEWPEDFNQWDMGLVKATFAASILSDNPEWWAVTIDSYALV